MSILTELEPAIYNKQDVTGRTYGQYTVIGKVGVHKYPGGSQHHLWLCSCSCGEEVTVQAQKVVKAIYGCNKCARNYSRANNSVHWKGGSVVSGFFFAKVKHGAQKRARDIEFNISLEYLDSLWVAQNGRCAYTGQTLEIGGSGEETTASLDRIDSSGGYVEGNVQFVHKTINKMKFDLTEEEFKNLCKMVTEHDQHSN